MSRLLLLLMLPLLVVGCGPTPVAEVDPTALVYQANDLGEPFQAGPVEARHPDILAATPAAARVATVSFTQGADLVGITTVLVYDTPEQAEASYNSVAQSSDVARLGDKASTDTHTATLGGTAQRVLDLAVLRCRTVTHLRFLRDALSPDAAKEYARAIDGRVLGLGC